jgi:D(-)-tartrate dehydratase
MRVLEIREKTVPISRYADPNIASGNLNTSMIAIVMDAVRDGSPVIGYGFSSFGRFAQGGLIRERFAPRLLSARAEVLLDPSGEKLDPFRAWDCMMKEEKPGGHGERCVAVGALDMALWDAAAKIAGQPLYRYLSEQLGEPPNPGPVPVYAGGGYYFPSDDTANLIEAIRRFLDQGYTRVKIKIGGRPVAEDLRRIEAVLRLLPGGAFLAVDAMNRYPPDAALEAARALEPYRLMLFEDICDPLDFETQNQAAREYTPPLAAGEALFSLADARNLLRYGGLRPDRDVLVFDPVHCYGVPEYLKILALFESSGWSRQSFQPHGGHLFSLHLAAALRLGGSESNPHNFQPFGGFQEDSAVTSGTARPPDVPGIGFETRPGLFRMFQSLL